MENVIENLPQHIAIIMDGNRRWAKQRNLDTKLGHKAGADNLETIAKYANKIGINYLTVYAFSTENWKRSASEVREIMLLLENYLKDFLKKAETDNIKIRILGDIRRLSVSLQKDIKKAIETTKDNTGLNLNIAFNYGGRDEIVRAVKAIAKEIKEQKLDINKITQETISNHLYTYSQPDPELIIRTSGEMRTSNFLPWQSVYAELYFTNKYWPDFQEEDLLEAITEYNKRNRRFGGK